MRCKVIAKSKKLYQRRFYSKIESDGLESVVGPITSLTVDLIYSMPAKTNVSRWMIHESGGKNFWLMVSFVRLINAVY